MGSAHLDLSDVAVVDNHCHGLELEELLGSDPQTFATRLTISGQALLTSSQRTNERRWAWVVEYTRGSVYSEIVQRWLAEYFAVADEPATFADERDRRLRADPTGYIRTLLDDEHITDLLVDEGFTYMPVEGGAVQQIVGRPAHRVVRIEAFIDDLIKSDRAIPFDDFVDGFESALRTNAADSATVALKTVIAYRTGLDIQQVSSSEARAAFQQWRADGFIDSRRHSKLVRDFLVHRSMAVARDHDIPMHVHVGDGDEDVVFEHSRPQDLYRFLVEYADQPVVLMHAGFPWSEEAAYLAAIMPAVFVDLSVLVPWASIGIDSYLERLLGMMPSSKLLYSSDQVYEPEFFWIAARFARRALERVLGGAIDRDLLSERAAVSIAQGVLGGNCRRLHGL